MVDNEKDLILKLSHKYAVTSELLSRRAEGPISLLVEMGQMRERMAALERRLLCLEAENRSLLMALDRAQWNNTEPTTWQANAGIPQL